MPEQERLPLKVINLWGAPGCGKSTLAAALFNLMKSKGLSVELVSEYAKDLTWEKNWTALSHQPSITAQQDYRIFRLNGKVDWVITDSPIPMGIAYMGSEWLDTGLDTLAWELYDRYQNYHVLVQKGDFQYDPVGRNQNEAEASVLANIMDNLFGTAITDEEEYSLEVTSGPYTAHTVFNKLIAPELDEK